MDSMEDCVRLGNGRRGDGNELVFARAHMKRGALLFALIDGSKLFAICRLADPWAPSGRERLMSARRQRSYWVDGSGGRQICQIGKSR